jgi:PAS domain S-box-containing protein
MKPLKSSLRCRDEDGVLKMLSEDLPVGVCIMQDGVFCYVNPAFPLAIGYTMDELIGKGSLDIVLAEDRGIVRENTMKMLKGELLSPYQFRVACKDGSIAWVMATVKPIQYHGRQAVLGNYMEITGRRQAEEELQAERNKLQSLVDAMEDTVTIQDTEYNIIYQNEPSRIASGGDHVGEKCYRVYEGRETVCEGCPVKRAFKDGKSHTAERMTTIRGTVTFWENTANPIRDAEGKIVSCLELTRDITKRKKQEQALADELTQHRLLIDKSLDGIVVLDVDATVVEANQRFAEMLGYTLDEVRELHTWDWDKNFPPEQILEMGRNVDENGLHLETKHTRKDGSVIDVDISISGTMYGGRKLIFCIQRDITERKRADKALRNSEESYRELADSISDIFFAMDEHLKYTYWNKASEILTGVRAEDALGKSLSEVFPNSPGLRRAEKVYRAVLKTQKGRTFANDYDIDGRHYIFEISAYPSRGGISVFVRDITERKQAEEALKEAKEEKSSFLEEAPVGIIHTDLAGEITYVNKRFESETGYSREGIIGKSGLQLDWFPASTMKYLSKRMAARLRGSPAKHWETQFKCKDGRWIWIELEGKVLRRSGVPVGFQVIATNITERKQAEEALKRSEERYRTILEEMEEGYYEVDIGGNFTFVNDAMCGMLGYSRDELIGMNYKTFTRRKDIKPIFKAYNGVYRTGEPLKWFPMVEVRRDGTRLLVEDSVLAMRNDEGRVIGFRGVSRDVTERRRAEEALELQRAYFQQLFDNSPDAIVILDTDTKLVQANKGFEKLFGYSPTEVEGRAIRELIIPEDRLEEASVVFRTVFRGKAARKELVRRRKDGGLLDVSMVAYPIRFDGTLMGICSIYSNITERKHAQEALRQSEERYRTILEDMEDAYFEVDLGGHLTFVNNAVCRDLGYSREELLGRSYKTFTVEDDVGSVFGVFNEVYLTGVPNKGFPWKTVRKDGTHGFAETSISLLRNGERGIIGFRGVGRDITERKKMEEALRQSEANYRTLFNSSVIGMYVLDVETMKVIMGNASAAKMFGLPSAEEAVGANLLDFIPPENRENVLDIVVKEPFEHDLRRSHEVEAITKDGRRIWVSMTGARIMHGGRPAGLISSADITDQKRQNERLMTTDRLASVGELAAGAAHELNNPLASIIGLSELLMEKDTPNYIRKDLAMIRDEARRAANVTSSLLTFARKRRPVKQPTQINAIIDDVLKLRAYAHKLNCIDVERHLAPDLPEILADPVQMQQVFLNIVINAEYFMLQAHNRGRLTITTKRQTDGVAVAFADDGPGIPPENLSRIFDPFFTTKEAGKGTGLGLSICHGIVAAHGGQIYARSQLGGGATISIELPIDGSNHVEVML